MGRNLSLGGYDHWKTTDPAERWPDEWPDDDDEEPEMIPVECADLVPLVPVDG